MHINAAANLALPIRWHEINNPKKGEPKAPDTLTVPLVWAYHTPISPEVFEANHRIIAATNFVVFEKGLPYALQSGVLTAALELRDAARKEAEESGLGATAPDIGGALLGEFKRLTTVLAPSADGFDSIPVDVAIKRGVIDAGDWKEAESTIAFFTCAFYMCRRHQRQARQEFLASALGGSITSSSAMDFAASLQTLTPTATSETVAQSSIPS